MRPLSGLTMLAVLLGVAVAAGSVLAAAPPTNPNGFPSGDHYNLNLIGKKAGFDGCSVLDPVTQQPVYGNVVFVPENGQGDIWLKSGSGRKGAGVTTLQVTDPCVTAFDSDAAEVQLPALFDGYWVYARALGKLTDNPSMTITPELITVSSTSTDETLVYLGLVTPNGFVKPDGTTVTRTKGKHPALPISDLFAWAGSVCYTSDPASFGLTEYPLTPICALDTTGDGIPDEILEPIEGACTLPYTLTELYCQHYDTTWVFNIADFVDYLWGIDNSGTKLLQIRFYPR